MDQVTPALASVFLDVDAAALWSKLRDDKPLSQLHSKYWGKKIEDETEQWRIKNPTVDDPANDIYPGCCALHLGVDTVTSNLWVRQDYIRIYDFCRDRYAKGPSSKTERPRSVIITGQPGIGVLLSSAASCALSNNPSHEKVKHFGSLTPSVVVSANAIRASGIMAASVTYSSRTEFMNYASRMSPPENLCRSYGLSSTRTTENMVSPKDSLF
jgi:hypothetical protein